MIIALKNNHEKKYVAYGIYWVTREENLLRIYATIDHNDEWPGFSYFEEHEVDIIDPSLDHYIMIEGFFEGDKRFHKELFAHKAAYPSEGFYMALCNHDDYANVETLFKNMRSLGLEPYFE